MRPLKNLLYNSVIAKITQNAITDEHNVACMPFSMVLPIIDLLRKLKKVGYLIGFDIQIWIMTIEFRYHGNRIWVEATQLTILIDSIFITT